MSAVGVAAQHGAQSWLRRPVCGALLCCLQCSHVRLVCGYAVPLALRHAIASAASAAASVCQAATSLQVALLTLEPMVVGAQSLLCRRSYR